MTSKPWIGAADAQRLTTGHFQQAAEPHGIEPAALMAVWDVEASGSGFNVDGSLKRRFEPHHMKPVKMTWRGSLALPEAQRTLMFDEAFDRSPEAALRATSFGGPQIMGFNAVAAGFPTALAMVEAMAASEYAHLTAFITLAKTWGLLPALRAKDWLAFAKRWNGTGQPEVYARKIEAAYRRRSGGKTSPVVLRVGDRGDEVRQLQRLLGLPVDGAFGPETHTAVIAFQGLRGLTPDGEVGAMTWGALTKEPPAKATPTTALVDRADKVVAVGGAGVAALEGARRALPDDLFLILAYVAFGVAVAWGVRWLYRRWRDGW